MATKTKSYVIELGPGGRQAKLRGLEIKKDTIVISAISYSAAFLSDNKLKEYPFSVGDTINVLEDILLETDGPAIIVDTQETNDKGEVRRLEATPAVSRKIKALREERETARRRLTDAKFAEDYDADLAKEAEEARVARGLLAKIDGLNDSKKAKEAEVDKATEAQAKRTAEFDKLKAELTKDIDELKAAIDDTKTEMESAGVVAPEIKEAQENPLPPRFDEGEDERK